MPVSNRQKREIVKAHHVHLLTHMMTLYTSLYLLSYRKIQLRFALTEQK